MGKSYPFFESTKKTPLRCISVVAGYLNQIPANEASAAQENLALNIEKHVIPRLNREIIAGVPLQESRLDQLKSEHFDPDALWNRIHGDLSLLRELVELFAAEVPGMLARIEKAIKHGSPSDLEKASHKLKGSMLQFSAHAAANIALQLEESGQTSSMDGTGMLLEKLKKEINVLQQTLRAMLQSGPNR